VLDNYGTHKTALVRRWLQKRPRYHLHFTPTHASWLNQVERWFALLTQRQIKRGSHTSVQELEEAIQEFITVHNQQPKPFRWTKSEDQILASIARFATSTLAAHAPEIYARNQ
jgi:transposase